MEDRIGDLNTFSDTITPSTYKELSVREAALETNAANKFTVNRCKCKGKCNGGLCSCVKSNINCTNQCHPGRNCENTCKRLSGEKEPKLHSKDITTLKSPLEWLTDNEMFLANYALKKDTHMLKVCNILYFNKIFPGMCLQVNLSKYCILREITG